MKSIDVRGLPSVALPMSSAIAVAVAVLGGVAFAASLVLGAGSLGAAKASTPRCTAAGLSVIQNLASASVVSVTISSLPATCGNGTLQVTVNNGAATGSGTGTIPGGGGSVTVTLAPAPAVTAAESTDVVVLGP